MWPLLNKFLKLFWNFCKIESLINKFKKLEDQNSNQTLIFKILGYIIYFKSLIIKITLITFLIKWIKKYSLVKNLWHIFSAIGSTLLSISLIDIYSLDVISGIKDTQIYKWFSDLIINPKISLPQQNQSVEFQKNTISEGSIKDANGIQTEINSSNRQDNRNIIEEINNKPESLRKQYIYTENQLEDNNDKTNFKKYLLIGSMLIVSGITIWCYFNDIKPGDATNTVIDKIKSFLYSFNSDQNNIIDNNTGNNSTNIQTNVNSDIQLSDNTNPIKGKSRVLTSPSLDNLNEQAESSWNASASSSNISSPDSDKTITQASISTASDSLISGSNLIKNIWRNRLTTDVNDKINFIESCFNTSNKLGDEIKLSDYFAYIINEYNVEIDTYNFMKSNTGFNDKNLLDSTKESLYYFREWIAEYQNKIFP